METYTAYTWKRAIARHGRGQPLREQAFPLDAGGGATSDMRQMVFLVKEKAMPMQQESMFSPEDSHARTTQWQDRVEDWLATVEHSGGSSTDSLLRDVPDGLSARMSLASSVAEAAEISARSSTPLPNSGIASDGVCLTLNTSEWPKDADVCSLSQVLETDPSPKFLLSPKACRGILNRAARRGRKLPEGLAEALEACSLMEE